MTEIKDNPTPLPTKRLELKPPFQDENGEEISGVYVHENEYRAGEAAAFARGVAAASKAQAEAVRVPDNVVKDAELYRWLRNGDYSFNFAQRILNDTPLGIDAAIDAAMLKEEK